MTLELSFSLAYQLLKEQTTFCIYLSCLSRRVARNISVLRKEKNHLYNLYIVYDCIRHACAAVSNSSEYSYHVLCTVQAVTSTKRKCEQPLDTRKVKRKHQAVVVEIKVQVKVLATWAAQAQMSGLRTYAA